VVGLWVCEAGAFPTPRPCKQAKLGESDVILKVQHLKT
jgi:hypothetical protein